MIDDKQVQKIPTKSQEIIKDFLNKDADDSSSNKGRAESEMMKKD